VCGRAAATAAMAPYLPLPASVGMAALPRRLLPPPPLLLLLLLTLLSCTLGAYVQWAPSGLAAQTDACAHTTQHFSR
jgi:hypothetical protein